jgi:flagellar biogenesis protein FliO
MTTETLQTSGRTFHTEVMAWWQRLLRLGRRNPRRLRLCESLALGERRFVAVVEFEAARFLLGGTPSSLVLLSRLPDAGGAENGAELGKGQQERGSC